LHGVVRGALVTHRHDGAGHDAGRPCTCCPRRHVLSQPMGCLAGYGMAPAVVTPQPRRAGRGPPSVLVRAVPGCTGRPSVWGGSGRMGWPTAHGVPVAAVVAQGWPPSVFGRDCGVRPYNLPLPSCRPVTIGVGLSSGAGRADIASSVPVHESSVTSAQVRVELRIYFSVQRSMCPTRRTLRR
jgi:hypothetical protein